MIMSTTTKPTVRVVVVGGGIIGLASALALLESGFKHVHVVAASFDTTTSHGAGAIWQPFALPSNVSPHKTLRWCEVSYAWLERIWSQHGEKAGIHHLMGKEVDLQAPPPVVHPYWAHVVKDFRILEKEEANAFSAGATHGISFGTFIYNPNVFMKWLTAKIQALGGTFEQRRINSLDDIEGDLVVNCVGLAAHDLVNDTDVYPIRGQTIKAIHPDIKQFAMVVDRDGLHTYILPRPGGEIVLGGTVQADNWSTDNSDADVAAIWERCCSVVPALRESKRIGQWAGLRPGRKSGVRLELDAAATGRGARVIHNYGHSGSGHTLQWGCAQDVVALAIQTFGSPSISRL